jgi:hypothetical protein
MYSFYTPFFKTLSIVRNRVTGSIGFSKHLRAPSIYALCINSYEELEKNKQMEFLPFQMCNSHS